MTELRFACLRQCHLRRRPVSSLWNATTWMESHSAADPHSRKTLKIHSHRKPRHFLSHFPTSWQNGDTPNFFFCFLGNNIFKDCCTSIHYRLTFFLKSNFSKEENYWSTYKKLEFINISLILIENLIFQMCVFPGRTLTDFQQKLWIWFVTSVMCPHSSGFRKAPQRMAPSFVSCFRRLQPLYLHSHSSAVNDGSH